MFSHSNMNHSQLFSHTSPHSLMLNSSKLMSGPDCSQLFSHYFRSSLGYVQLVLQLPVKLPRRQVNLPPPLPWWPKCSLICVNHTKDQQTGRLGSGRQALTAASFQAGVSSLVGALETHASRMFVPHLLILFCCWTQSLRCMFSRVCSCGRNEK